VDRGTLPEGADNRRLGGLVAALPDSPAAGAVVWYL
jgi:hypothetical protein